MVRSKKVIVLATMAIVTFPVTIGIVALDLRSLIAAHNSKPDKDIKDNGVLSRDPNANPNTSAEGAGGVASTPTQAQASAPGRNEAASNDAAVMAVLRSRVSVLSTAIEKSKEDEGRIKAELKENQSFQVSTNRSLKATERAIKEIEKQSKAAPLAAGALASSTLRGADQQGRLPRSVEAAGPGPGPGAGAGQGRTLPSGWETYYGILGVGFGRAYKASELASPQSFLDGFLALPTSAHLADQDMQADLPMHRIVHISGLGTEDPRLEELRKIGLDKSTEFKRVRHELPGFEGPYVMVQVLPAMSVRRALNGGDGSEQPK